MILIILYEQYACSSHIKSHIHVWLDRVMQVGVIEVMDIIKIMPGYHVFLDLYESLLFALDLNQ